MLQSQIDINKAFRNAIKRYGDLSETELRDLFLLGEVMSYSKGTKVTDMGDHSPVVYLLLSGLAIKYFYRNKSIAVIQIATQHEIMIPFSCYIGNHPSDIIIETLEDAVIFSIRKDTTENPECPQKLLWIQQKMFAEHLNRKEHREIEHLTFEGKARFQRFVKQHADLVQRVSQKYLAAYLNIKPETFSRFKGLFQKHKKKQVS